MRNVTHFHGNSLHREVNDSARMRQFSLNLHIPISSYVITMKLIHKVLLLIACSCYAARAGDMNDVGRYQLIIGSLDQGGDTGPTHTRTAMFRIDTITGQTWVYNRCLIKGPRNPDGTFAEAWVPMCEDFQASIYLATGVAKGWQEAHIVFTNSFASTNALREAMDRMYWPPKRRDEYEAIVAEAAFQHYRTTNRSVGATEQPAVQPKERK